MKLGDGPKKIIADVSMIWSGVDIYQHRNGKRMYIFDVTYPFLEFSF